MTPLSFYEFRKRTSSFPPLFFSLRLISFSLSGVGCFFANSKRAPGELKVGNSPFFPPLFPCAGRVELGVGHVILTFFRFILAAFPSSKNNQEGGPSPPCLPLPLKKKNAPKGQSPSSFCPPPPPISSKSIGCFFSSPWIILILGQPPPLSPFSPYLRGLARSMESLNPSSFRGSWRQDGPLPGEMYETNITPPLSPPSFLRHSSR